MKRVIAHADDMQALAAEYVAALRPNGSAATVVELSGELGVGKTTFAQAVARSLGIGETVHSPTFVIQKIYALQGRPWNQLVHVDAYRLTSGEELRRLGWDELAADPGSLVLIEWPEHVEAAMPAGARRVAIRLADDDARMIEYDS